MEPYNDDYSFDYDDDYQDNERESFGGEDLQGRASSDERQRWLESCVRRVVQRALQSEQAGSPLACWIRREAAKLAEERPVSSVRQEELVVLVSDRICRSMAARLAAFGHRGTDGRNLTERWEFDTVVAVR